MSPQYGGVWTLESSSLTRFPTAIVALNRSVCDGTSDASGLIPIPEEWLVERDWHIANHWEDQLCRERYLELRVLEEMQHLRCSHSIAWHNPICMSSGVNHGRRSLQTANRTLIRWIL